MRRRSLPYPPPGGLVRVPRALWDEAVAALRAYGEIGEERGVKGSEGLVYVAGVVVQNQLVVTGLYKLNHEPQGDRVVVTAEESRWLLRTLRERDEKLIGQIHTHRWEAMHSPGDDMYATSFHNGFLSVVVPHFGRAAELTRCAIYEFVDGQFLPLSTEQIVSRVVLVDPVIDRPITRVDRVDHKEERWPGFAKRLKSIAQRLR